MDPMLQKYLSDQMDPMDRDMLLSASQPDYRAEEAASEKTLMANLGRAGETIARAYSPGVNTGGDQFYRDMAASGQADMARAAQGQNRKIQMLKYLQGRQQQKAERDLSQQRHDETIKYREKTDTERAEAKKSEEEYRRSRDTKADSFKQQQLDLQREKAKGTGEKEKKLSPTAVKKQGLAKIGKAAEDQYRIAVAKGKKSGQWDPTSYGDWMDNSALAPNFMKSDASIEARAAMRSWGDSYLRDESGAAIPEPERESYYQTYFPQKGDSEETVDNKAKLRWQKMNNALIASGQEELAFEPISPTPEKGQAMAQDGLVKIQAPDGTINFVPENRADYFVRKGGKRVE